MLKGVGILLVILAVILPTYLSVVKAISEVLFGLIFIAFLIAGFLLYKINEIVEFETKFVKLKTLQEEIYAKAEEVKKLSEELNQDKKELREATRVFIESFYLTLQTRNIFPIPQQIAQEIEKNLNILASFAVGNENDRKSWIQRIQGLLNK